MRAVVSVFAFGHLFLFIEAQTVDKRSAMVGPDYCYLKYAISFADQVQVAYDGTTDLKGSHFMPPSIA